ncbi:MAG: HD domain-containing protein [Chloracidobacterium sp.]|nr:HD domain-containing protein [Chloracidobacterium sp.]
MPPEKRKVSLIYFVTATLLLVGLVPLVLTGWILSDKSGRELRAAENRYQIQLVQEKARQIEMFGKRFGDLVSSISVALELSNDVSIVSSPQTELKLGSILRENPDLLALHVKPSTGESLSVFRSETINKIDVESISDEVAWRSDDEKLEIGVPKKIPSSGETTMAFGSTVKIDGENAAEVVAIVSLRDIQRSVVGMVPSREEDLWNSGLPIIFVVDQTGAAVFHPDQTLVSERRSLGDLKIVGEWLEAGETVQSALVPFTAEFHGKKHEMIGAYSTVNLGKNTQLGVITMQDESKALASVGEMRAQTWLISMIFAVCALVVGFIGARFMTAPLTRLVSAAKKIGAGDFTTRVETGNLTEIGTLGETFNVMTDKIEEQINSLAKAAQENHELFVGTVKALATAIDGKDKYTRGHSERVARISVAMGKRLGMDEKELETLRMSALLHDVGKIAIDDSILKKSAALTDAEYEIMKTHPQRGYKIMSQIPGMDAYLPGMYMHHEMVNGKGYPQGLTGDQIPLQAKIVSVADTFDAMTIDRPYSKGMDLPSALERLRSFVGTRYQGEVVEALVDACNSGEVANGIVRQMAEKRAANEEAKISAKLVA